MHIRVQLATTIEKIFIQNSIWVSKKTQKLMLISNPRKKLQKKLTRKKLSTEKLLKNRVSYFYSVTVSKSFRPITFLGDNSVQLIRNQHQSLRFMIPISNF
jgi:hypothetical protein